MDLNSTYIGRYFVTNFALILISLVTIIMAIQHFKQHRRVSTYTILLLSSTLILSICTDVESYAKETYTTGKEGLYYLAMICSATCYILRPACICFMILMSGHFVPKKFLWIVFLPLMINATIFLCAFIPGTEDIIYGFSKGSGGLGFRGGYLRYAVHIISALYLAFFLVVIIMKLKAKHINHTFMLLVCAAFVIAAVVIESFFNSNSTIQILNTTIAVSALVYYLYLYIERTETDGLTGLFNRESFYKDKIKLSNRVTGVIQYDMDGLKYINDNFGHAEGDKALRAIAAAINASITKSMYAYRLGGDEFIVLVTGSGEDTIQQAISLFKKELNKTDYHCSVGCSYRQGRDIALKMLIKESEEAMYADKEEFYKTARIERRKAEKM